MENKNIPEPKLRSLHLLESFRELVILEEARKTKLLVVFEIFWIKS